MLIQTKVRRWGIPAHKLRAFPGHLLWILGVIAVMAFYIVVQTRSYTPATTEVDCEGYFVLGRRIAHGEAPGRVLEDQFQYQSHVWVLNQRGELLPKYDPGYPALIAIALLAGGDGAGFLVNPVMGGVALLGSLALFMLWMSRWPALFAFAALAGNSLFQTYAGYPLAHASELAFISWGAYFLWRWTRSPTYWAAIAAGLLLGYAVAIRHTALLMAPSVAVAMVAVQMRYGGWNRMDFRRSVALGAAYIVFPALIALYHWRWFGGPFTSGYSLCGEQGAFAWKYFKANMPGLADAMMSKVAWGLFPLSLAGIASCGPRHERLMRAFWFIGVFLVYAAYYWAPTGTAYWRFFYSLLPLIVGCAFMLVDMLFKKPYAKFAAAAMLLVLAMAYAFPQVARDGLAGRLLQTVAKNEAAAAAALKPHLDPDAVLFIGRQDNRRLKPLENGLGACRFYNVYRLKAFEPEAVMRTMPDWIDPTSRPPDKHTDWHVRWRVKVQESRKRALLDYYAMLGGEGIVRQRDEIILRHLDGGRQVALLLPAGAGRDWMPARERFSEAITFGTPEAGEWTLMISRPPRCGYAAM